MSRPYPGWPQSSLLAPVTRHFLRPISSPCSVSPPQCASQPQNPILSTAAVLGVTLVFSQGLPGSHFWQSPGLLLSALPLWPHPVRKGGATGEERWGAPGRIATGRQCLDVCQDSRGQPSPRHKGLSVRHMSSTPPPTPPCNLGGSCFLTQRRPFPNWPRCGL